MSFQDDSLNKNNLRRLVDQLKSPMGVIPFVGAGLSKPFGFPLWKDFLIEQAPDSLKEKMQERISAGEYEEAAEDLVREIGTIAFNDAIEYSFEDRVLKDKKLDGAISLLPLLPLGPVITTNFDRTIEKVFENAGCKFEETVWGARVDLMTGAFRENKNYLLKIHGDYKDSRDRILTLSDYIKNYGDSYPINDQNFVLPNLLQQILIGRTIVFIGCSLYKDRTVELIGKVAEKYPNIIHFAIVEKPESNEAFFDRQRFLLKHGIRPIWFPKGKYDSIIQILSYLIGQIPPKFRQKSSEMNIIPQKKYYCNSIGMEFVLIPAGEFDMGSEDSECLFSWEKMPRKDDGRLIEFLMQNFNIESVKTAKIEKNDDGKTIRVTIEQNNGRTDEFIAKTENDKLNIYSKKYPWENPIHKVMINNPFYLGIFPVTQRQWKKLMENNPSYFKGDNLPVERVSWNDVQEFITKLNKHENENKYFLPSEAEWEYAIRAGTTTSYFFGNEDSELGKYAWYNENSESQTNPVGGLYPNQWELYDMVGNVWEWVQDTWHDSYDHAPPDNRPWEVGDGSHRTVRGGCWNTLPTNSRSAARTEYHAGTREHTIGFRLMKVL